MKVQAFPSNGETIYDKVKCPSLDEIGCNKDYGTYAPIVEGTIYPIFGTQQLNPNTLAIYKVMGTIGGGAVSYATRSMERNNPEGDTGYCVLWSNGTAHGSYYTNSAYTICCIRF